MVTLPNCCQSNSTCRSECKPPDSLSRVRFSVFTHELLLSRLDSAWGAQPQHSVTAGAGPYRVHGHTQTYPVHKLPNLHFLAVLHTIPSSLQLVVLAAGGTPQGVGLTGPQAGLGQ